MINAFEKLTDLDKSMIKSYINNYGSCDAAEDFLPLRNGLDHILRFWNTNKEDLFKMFAGEVILSKEISITKPKRVLEEDISKAIYYYGTPARKFYDAYYEKARELAPMKEHYCYGDLYYKMVSLMDINYLCTNIYGGVAFSIDTPDGHQIQVAPGCKVSKMLGKIAKAFNLPGFEDFRIVHSMCLNQKSLKGELCISIHPLDYMTMSDNNCDWDSCMSWKAPGDYRLGTVEMMNSPCVVVAYLRASEDMELCEGYDWNSKKWRQLFIVTPHIITGIRQYPYDSDELNAIVLKWLKDLAQTNMGWGPYSENMSKVRNYNNNVFADIGCESKIEFYTRFMYNDFYNEHNSYVAPSIPEYYKLCFSGETECMSCGEDISNYDDSMTDPGCLTCNDCEDVYWCNECGGRMSGNDYIIVDGCRICPYCYEEHYRSCHCCEETHHEESLITVYLIHEDEKDTSYSISVCENCIDSESFTKLFGHTRTVEVPCRWYTDNHTVVDLKNLTLDGLEYFDVWHAEDYEDYKTYIEFKSNGQT